ncbi:MAG: nucleoside hydrolase [Halobacteriovoraceae bacterium]|nr:nucleoside hydrolase [Halobacteriovoraceae bacterium]
MFFRNILILFIVLFFSFKTFSNDKKRVWFDYDLGFGKFAHDVDDGYALVHLLLSRDTLDLRGLSSVHGNTDDMNHQKRWTLKILDKLQQKDISHYSGASSKNQLGLETEASKAIIRELEKGPLTILASGRMTNIATVVLSRPDLIGNIYEIVINAGRKLESEYAFGPKKIIFPDTNVDGDLRALRVLVDHGLPLTMIPTESMGHILITKKHLKSMNTQGKILRWLSKKSQSWRLLWSLWTKTSGFIPWDVFVGSYLTHREDFHCLENINYDLVELENHTDPLFRKKDWKARKDFLVASFKLPSTNLGTYCEFINSEHLKKLITYWKNQLSSKSTLE